jgi:hypothetical protein
MRPILLILFALSVSFSPAQEGQWADPLPDPEGYTVEGQAEAWTGRLESTVANWPGESANIREQIHNLTTSCVELGNQTLSNDSADSLLNAVLDLLLALLYVDLADYFNDQAAPLVAKAVVALKAKSWVVSINYCTQAWPWIDDRDMCAAKANRYIADAGEAFYEAELAHNPEGVEE